MEYFFNFVAFSEYPYFKEYLHRMQRRLEEKIAENMTYHGISEESRRRSMSNDDEEEYEYEGNF